MARSVGAASVNPHGSWLIAAPCDSVLIFGGPDANGNLGGGVRRRPGQPENWLPPGDLIGFQRVGPPVTGEPNPGGLCS
ncbi:MAG: hypothetical protein ACJZ6C_10100 [Candidatus Poriferisodalaceae bacterium]